MTTMTMIMVMVIITSFAPVQPACSSHSSQFDFCPSTPPHSPWPISCVSSVSFLSSPQQPYQKMQISQLRQTPYIFNFASLRMIPFMQNHAIPDINGFSCSDSLSSFWAEPHHCVR